MFDDVTRRLADYVDDLEDAPAEDRVDVASLAARLAAEPPEHGRPFNDVLDQVFAEIIPAGINPASPGSLSYVNGGGLIHAGLADLIASITNRFGGFFAAGPGISSVEAMVIRWMAGVCGLPADAGGLLLTGGSMANLTAVVAARIEHVDPASTLGVVYTSEQSHHSVMKAAIVAGIPFDNIRLIPTDQHFRMRTDLLADAIEADRKMGLRPFCVVATAGATATGAIDDLAGIADIAREFSLWFHVDAAYGGFFRLTEHGRRVLAGIERADSITLDPHKSLFLPFGTGALLVRDQAILRRAFQLHSGCVISVADHGCDGAVNFADLSIEQTREARGLKVWLPLQLLGVSAFRQALQEKLELASMAANAVAAIKPFQLLTAPELSTFAFRWVHPSGDPVLSDKGNRAIVEAVNARKAVHLATAQVSGRTVIRVCVISFRTHTKHIEIMIHHLREAAASLHEEEDKPVRIQTRGSRPGTWSVVADE